MSKHTNIHKHTQPTKTPLTTIKGQSISQEPYPNITKQFDVWTGRTCPNGFIESRISTQFNVVKYNTVILSLNVDVYMYIIGVEYIHAMCTSKFFTSTMNTYP